MTGHSIDLQVAWIIIKAMGLPTQIFKEPKFFLVPLSFKWVNFGDKQVILEFEKQDGSWTNDCRHTGNP